MSSNIPSDDAEEPIPKEFINALRVSLTGYFDDAEEPDTWQDLTDEEIDDCKPAGGIAPLNDGYKVDSLWMYDFAEAVQEAVQEKNCPPKPSPSRKPMTEEEIDEVASRLKDARMSWGFIEGIRYAEKHHEIGGDDGSNQQEN